MDTNVFKKIWGKLVPQERMSLLSHCYSLASIETKSYEATLSWDKLMPTTQNDLFKVDWQKVLSKDLRA
jgi:hypothetical protein